MGEILSDPEPELFWENRVMIHAPHEIEGSHFRLYLEKLESVSIPGKPIRIEFLKDGAAITYCTTEPNWITP